MPGPCDFCQKIASTVLITSLLIDEPLHTPKKWVEGKTFSWCKPQSLIDWQIRNGIKQEKGEFLHSIRNKTYNYISVTSCAMHLVDILPGDARPIDWDLWDARIRSESSLWKSFPKGTMPPTQEMRFKRAVFELVQLLSQEEQLQKYLTILAFLKEHPMMNIILLQFAAVGADLQGKLTSRILVSPYEV